MEADVSQLRQLEADIGRIPGRAVPPLIKAVTTSGHRVRDALRADAAGIGHAPHFPNSITDEVQVKVGQIGAEIGPDKSLTQGALGNILYFGTSKNGPVLDINAPADGEAEALEKAAAEALGKLFET
jgi:hypothetical protein